MLNKSDIDTLLKAAQKLDEKGNYKTADTLHHVARIASVRIAQTVEDNFWLALAQARQAVSADTTIAEPVKQGVLYILRQVSLIIESQVQQGRNNAQELAQKGASSHLETKVVTARWPRFTNPFKRPQIPNEVTPPPGSVNPFTFFEQGDAAFNNAAENVAPAVESIGANVGGYNAFRNRNNVPGALGVVGLGALGAGAYLAAPKPIGYGGAPWNANANQNTSGQPVANNTEQILRYLLNMTPQLTNKNIVNQVTGLLNTGLGYLKQSPSSNTLNDVAKRNRQHLDRETLIRRYLSYGVSNGENAMATHLKQNNPDLFQQVAQRWKNLQLQQSKKQ